MSHVLEEEELCSRGAILRARRVPDSHPRPSFFRFSVAIWVHCRNVRPSKGRGLLQSVLALCMTEDKLARFALHAPPDGILAMCDRRAVMQSVCTWQNACSKRSTNSETRHRPSCP